MSMWPTVSPGASLTDGGGIGSLSFTTVKYLVSGGVVCSNFWSNYFFSKVSAIMPLTGGLGVSKKTWGIFPGQEVPKTFFWIAVAKADA